jgi:hypothetical protein
LRRAIIFMAVLLAASLPCRAQNITTVSATITDPNNLPYSFATVQAQLIPTGVTPTVPPPCNGQNVTPCVVSGFSRATTDVNGSFSMNLASNAVLSPGGTQWQFSVSETGIAAPSGTGPQSFVVAITISGGSQSISATLSAAAPALSRGLTGSCLNCVVKNPSGTAFANLIQPTDTVAVPLILQDFAGSTLPPFVHLDSGGTQNLTGNQDGSVLSNAYFAHTNSSNVTTTATGAFRLLNGDSICWRNNANSADLCLAKAATSADNLVFNGAPVVDTPVEQVLSINTTPVTVNTSTTVFQNLMSSQSPIAAGALNTLTKTARIKSSGTFNPVNNTETVNISFRVGAVGFLSFDNYIPGTAGVVYQWTMNVDCTTTTTGASGVLSCFGEFLIGGTNAGSALVSGTFPFSQAFTVDLTGTVSPQNAIAFNTASASNTGIQNYMLVEQLN